MERWAAVCGGDEVWTYRICGTPPAAQEGARTQLYGARALCYHAGTLLCASQWGDTLWQMDARTLAPLRVLPLGPGVSRILSVPHRDTLYALCEDADSIMTLSLQTGEPLMLARAGVQPRDMILDAGEGRLLIAAGAACEAEILCAQTLQLLGRVATPGLCVGAVFTSGGFCTLSMNEQAAGIVHFQREDGRMQRMHVLPALPGGLCPLGNGVLALYWGGAASVLPDGRRARTFPMDGLTERAAVFSQGVILCQPSVPRCMLWTTQGAQTLRGGSDACVYELPARG